MLARRHLRRATDVCRALLGSMSAISCGPADIIPPRPPETVADPQAGTPSATSAPPAHAPAGTTVAGDAGASSPASSTPSPEAGPTIGSTNDAGAMLPAPGDSPPISTAYNPARGKILADKAYALLNGKPSRDLCLAGVDDSVETSGIVPVPPGWTPRQPSAVAWGDH